MHYGPRDEPAQGAEKIIWLIAIPALAFMSVNELSSPDPDWMFALPPSIVALGGVGRLLGWVNRGSGH